MNRESRGFLSAVVSLTIGGAAFISGCTVGYQPQPVYTRPVYYAPPPRPAPPPPAYGQPAPAYASAPPAPGGPPAPAGGPPIDCVDPGPRDIPDRFDQAMPIEPQSQTAGCITPNDADMFIVTVPPASGGQLLRFTARGQNNLAPGVRIFNRDRRQLETVWGQVAGEARGWVHVAGGTPVYLRVAQGHSVRDVYLLTLTTEPLQDVGEPNNDMEHATPLREGSPVTAFMSEEANDPAAVEDWYRFEVHHDGPITIDIDMSEGIGPYVRVIDSDRRQVGSASGQHGEHLHYTLKLRHGVHYVRLRPTNDVAMCGEGEIAVRLQHPYTISLH